MATSRNERKPYSRPANRPKGTSGEWLHDKAPGVPTVLQTNGTKVAPALPNTKLIISNLHYEVTPKDLTSIFGKLGTLVREPLIRYDRSGRSSGVAIITYENPSEAATAIKEYNGLLCKNQPMSITFDSGPPVRNQGRRAVSAPSSLINRIQKPPLLDRLSKGQQVQNRNPAPTQNGAGPIRNRPRALARAPKKPLTAEELDKELDAFMKDDPPATATTSGSTEVKPSEDVDMVA